MSKKKPAKSVAVQYAPVEVRPQYCSDEELTLHLEAFVKSFIAKEHQERWLTFFVEKRSRWYPIKPNRPDKYFWKARAEFEMYFPVQTDNSQSIDGEEAYPQALVQSYGTSLGVYFSFMDPVCKITAAEAASLVLGRDGSRGGTAILSFVPGKKALFFDYEMDEGSQIIRVLTKS